MNSEPLKPILISAQDARPGDLNGQSGAPLSCQIRGGHSLFLMGLNHQTAQPYLQLLAGIETPVSGEVLVLGNDCQTISPQQLRELRRKVGFVLQGGPLLSVLNGFENLMLPARYHQLGSESERQEKAALLISEFPHQANYRILPAYMSKLERRLLAIARPLMLDPEVLFIDSPFDGLDQHDRVIIARYISNIANHHPITLVICSDDLYFAHSLASQIIFCDLEKTFVFDNWQSFYECKHETIALLFKHQVRSGNG